MASLATDPLFDPDASAPKLAPRPWRPGTGLASAANATDAFLAGRPFERGPWLVVAFAAGIAAWFVLSGPSQWLALVALCAAAGAGGAAALRADGDYPHLRAGVMGIAAMIAAGLAGVWTKSELVGAEPIARPTVAVLTGE